jgi:hypothetical protein
MVAFTPPFCISNDGEEPLAPLLAAPVRRLEERGLDVAVGHFAGQPGRGVAT